jgi:Fe2+ transport system protein FeoA
MITRLHMLRGGDRAVVREICGDHEVRQRLSSHGLHPGDAVQVLRAAFLMGPMLIEIHGVAVALGRGQAEAVEVELPELP